MPVPILIFSEGKTCFVKIVYTRQKYNPLENWFFEQLSWMFHHASVTVTSDKYLCFSCLRHSSNRNKQFLGTISQRSQSLELNLPCCQTCWALSGHEDCFCPSLTAPAFRLPNVLPLFRLKNLISLVFLLCPHFLLAWIFPLFFPVCFPVWSWPF